VFRPDDGVLEVETCSRLYIVVFDGSILVLYCPTEGYIYIKVYGSKYENGEW